MAHRNHAALPRRRFLKSASATAGVLTLPQWIPGAALGKGAVAPSERIVLGGIGIGGRGQGVLGDMLRNPEPQFVAIADARRQRREAIKRMADEHHGTTDCATYHDFRELLERPDIDAVLIATGDRWHALASILSAKAGKDIFCEKPCSMTIAESRDLAEVIRRYGVVYQAGTQRRTIGNFILAAELVADGTLGELREVHANTLNPAVTHDWLPAEPEPPADEVDWDMWLGPCPWRPYNESYVRGGWRGHFDFHGGGILEWGSHTVDLCQWAAQKDDTGPVEFEPSGSEVHARYADGVRLIMRDTGWLGLGTCSVRYVGSEGWVETGDSGAMQIHPEPLRAHLRIFTEPGTSPRNHVREFFDCVKTRALPSANADVACQSHIACHAAYIAWQLGRRLEWDPVAEEFPDDDEANRMRSRAYREPWRV